MWKTKDIRRRFMQYKIKYRKRKSDTKWRKRIVWKESMQWGILHKHLCQKRRFGKSCWGEHSLKHKKGYHVAMTTNFVSTMRQSTLSQCFEESKHLKEALNIDPCYFLTTMKQLTAIFNLLWQKTLPGLKFENTVS